MVGETGVLLIVAEIRRFLICCSRKFDVVSCGGLVYFLLFTILEQFNLGGEGNLPGSVRCYLLG